MKHDPFLSRQRTTALRADHQERADLLARASKDFARRAHNPASLEAALARWLMEFRQSFGDRFNTHALLTQLPLPADPTSDRTELRLRQRVALSADLRDLTFRAIARRRDALRLHADAEAQTALRTHTRAYGLVSAPDFEGSAARGVEAALDVVLEEPALPFGALSHLLQGQPIERASLWHGAAAYTAGGAVVH